MANPMCMNVTKSQTDQYSSPVPLIGLYIAGATMVCFLLILFDMVSGLRRKTRYVPCRLFPLNSVTLSLLGVATKLPVDLTSYMPSAFDQLSKLTGTTLICVCMAFFFSSIGVYRRSENLSNLLALSIFVVTVAVNICIQMSTKVIFSFIVEHILILCMMVWLLLTLWFCAFDKINYFGKESLAKRNEQIFEEGEGTLMHRVKRWYMYSCMHNPQLLLCRMPYCSISGSTCAYCGVILSQAVYRSLVPNKKELCKGISDYGWSMKLIVISQILTISVASLAVVFRWFALVHHFNVEAKDNEIPEFEDFEVQFFTMQKQATKMSIVVLSRALLRFILTIIFVFLLLVINMFPTYLSYRLSRVIEHLCPPLCQTIKGVSISSWENEFPFVSSSLPKWIMMVCVKDMNKLMIEASKRFSSSSSMSQILSRPRPSTQNLLETFQRLGLSLSAQCKVSCLTVVLLVKVLVVSVPSSFTKSLRQALDEAFEVIYFIDERINERNFVNQRKREIAKLLWKGGDLRLGKEDLVQHHVSVDNTLSRFEAAHQIAREGYMKKEVKVIRDFIHGRNDYTSVEELCKYVEQLFAEMLHWFLSQLPSCILKEIRESPIEEYEEIARKVLKLVYELDPSLDNKVQWSFPGIANVIHFFDPLENHDEELGSSL